MVAQEGNFVRNEVGKLVTVLLKIVYFQNVHRFECVQNCRCAWILDMPEYERREAIKQVTRRTKNWTALFTSKCGFRLSVFVLIKLVGEAHLEGIMEEISASAADGTQTMLLSKLILVSYVRARAEKQLAVLRTAQQPKKVAALMMWLEDAKTSSATCDGEAFEELVVATRTGSPAVCSAIRGLLNFLKHDCITVRKINLESGASPDDIELFQEYQIFGLCIYHFTKFFEIDRIEDAGFLDADNSIFHNADYSPVKGSLATLRKVFKIIPILRSRKKSDALKRSEWTVYMTNILKAKKGTKGARPKLIRTIAKPAAITEHCPAGHVRHLLYGDMGLLDVMVSMNEDKFVYKKKRHPSRRIQYVKTLSVSNNINHLWLAASRSVAARKECQKTVKGVTEQIKEYYRSHVN